MACSPAEADPPATLPTRVRLIASLPGTGMPWTCRECTMILPWGQTTRSRESRTQSAPPGRRAGLGTITGSNEPSQIPAGPDRSDLDEYGHWPAPRPRTFVPARAGTNVRGRGRWEAPGCLIAGWGELPLTGRARVAMIIASSLPGTPEGEVVAVAPITATTSPVPSR